MNRGAETIATAEMQGPLGKLHIMQNIKETSEGKMEEGAGRRGCGDDEGRLRVSGRMRKRRWAEGKARDERTMKAG